MKTFCLSPQSAVWMTNPSGKERYSGSAFFAMPEAVGSVGPAMIQIVMALAGCAATHDSARIAAACVASHIPMRLARGRGDSKAFLSRFVGFGCVIIRAVLARNALIYSLVIPPCVPRDLSGAIFSVALKIWSIA
ncbi:hypothetical protein [Caballeronia choica]|uniref:hypothetical protein n=1 Tax=Caballeronia choica TaxID=326476 RepID=UPI000F738AD3|nr:hypothetical protein [Caballeronia choica]